LLFGNYLHQGLKPRNFYTERSRGFESPLPRTESPGLPPTQAAENSVSDEILALSGFYETAGFVNWFLVFS
jgi:hypothetical protein